MSAAYVFHYMKTDKTLDSITVEMRYLLPFVALEIFRSKNYENMLVSKTRNENFLYSWLVPREYLKRVLTSSHKSLGIVYMHSTKGASVTMHGEKFTMDDAVI